VPALVAAGAKAVIGGAEGTRTIAVEDVPTGPGRTSLAKGEIIEAIVLESPPPRSADAYLRFIPRTEMDIAVVGVGVSLTLKDGVCTAARVGLGAVAPTVLLVEPAAKALIGSKLDEAAFEAHARLDHNLRFVSRVATLIDHPLDVTRARPLEVGPRGVELSLPVRGHPEDVGALDPEDVVGVTLAARAQLLSEAARGLELATGEARKCQRPHQRRLQLNGEAAC